MTKCIIECNKSKEIISILVQGHTNMADEGEDIVCAALSVTTISVLNSIQDICQEDVDVITNEEEGLIFCEFNELKNKDKTNILLQHFKNTILEIQKEYPDFVSVDVREV